MYTRYEVTIAAHRAALLWRADVESEVIVSHPPDAHAGGAVHCTDISLDKNAFGRVPCQRLTTERLRWRLTASQALYAYSAGGSTLWIEVYTAPLPKYSIRVRVPRLFLPREKPPSEGEPERYVRRSLDEDVPS